MINIDEQAANKLSDLVWAYGILIAFGAVGFLAGRLSGYNKTDLEIANIEGQLAQQGIRIKQLKDVDAYLNDDAEE